RIVEDSFLGLGYEIRDDSEVETVEYNFDKLAFAPTHSSRSPRDTFYFDETHLLRTETSPSQIHILEEKEPPIYMVSIGRVWRRGMPNVQVQRLARDGRRRCRRPAGVRERGRRHRALVRFRVRLRPRAGGAAAPRHPGHPAALGRRPPRAEAVLMRVPLSWLRE